MKAIINRGQKFSTLNGVITETSALMLIIFKAIKLGKATLVVDNDNTLMYILN